MKTGRPKREHHSREEASSPPFRKRRTKEEPEDRNENTNLVPQYKVETDSEYDESEEEVSNNEECDDDNIPLISKQSKWTETADLAELESIDAIIRFMDKIEPEKKYFERQMDNRNGCSKIRGKLRKFARKKENKNNDAVVFWLDTNKWHPRNTEELRAIVQLLTNMIDESWPTLAIGN